MRIVLRALKRFIREVAATAASMPIDVGLIVRESNGHVTMALVRLNAVKSVLDGMTDDVYTTLNQGIIGGITAGMYDVWRVTNVKADKGYGPLLYRLAMQYATTQGSSLSSDPDGSTTPDAQGVWDRFAEQPDVEVVFLGDEHGDQRDIAYQLEGNEARELAQRYDTLVSQYDQGARDELDEALDEAIGEAVATFG